MDALRKPITELTEEYKIKYDEYFKNRNKYIKKMKKLERYQKELDEIEYYVKSDNTYCTEMIWEAHRVRRKMLWLKRYMIRPFITPEIEDYIKRRWNVNPSVYEEYAYEYGHFVNP